MIHNFPGGFTVLMAVYKGDNHQLFDKSLQSIYLNSLAPNNIVLVVDGEIPEALNLVILKYVHHENLFVHRINKNSGLANALNEGLRFVNTEWVVRADADDISLTYRFEKMAKYAKTHNYLDVIGANILEIEPSGEHICKRIVPISHHSIEKCIKFRSPLNHMTVCYKKNIVDSVGGYPDLYLKEDYGLWVLLINKGYIFGNLNEILVHATTGNDMFKRRGGIRYIISEINLQYFLYINNINGALLAVLILFFRSSIFALPHFIRRYFYIKFLRKNLLD